MKKLLSILLSLLLVATCCVACSSPSEEPTESTDTASTDTASTDAVSPEFEAFMQSIFDAHPGTAGGEEKTAEAAKAFVDYAFANGENITEEEIAGAAELFLNEKATEDNTYVENFKAAFAEVQAAALTDNAELETDVYFLKYVNGIQYALDTL